MEKTGPTFSGPTFSDSAMSGVLAVLIVVGVVLSFVQFAA